MAKPKIKWNIKGFEEVRKRADVADLTFEAAERIAAACGEGFMAVRGEGRSRSRASVIPVTPRAINRNRRDNTILRNIEAGR